MSENVEKYNNDYCVYFHRNIIDNCIFYVGMGNEKRPYYFRGRGIIWSNYVKKYGNPIVEVYKSRLNILEATVLESTLIKTFGRRRFEKYGILINQKFGDRGMSGYKMSEETKRKISKAFSGKNGINTGRKHTYEARRNMSAAKKGRKMPPELKDKMLIAWRRNPRKGYKTSEETKEKLRKYNLGKKVSEETRLKMSKAKKGCNTKRIIDTKTGNIYNSLIEAGSANGVSSKMMWKWVNGVFKKRAGRFEYYGK